jgi:hypothetical protein
MGTAASMPKEVTVKGEYKMYAEEYKAYILAHGGDRAKPRASDTPPLLRRHPDSGKAANAWEAKQVDRKMSLARERRAMLAEVRQRPTVVVRRPSLESRA